MTMKNEIKASLIASMELILDPYMAENGFSRAKSGMIYKRSLSGSTQKIDIAVQIHPKDRPDAAAAIYPQMEVFIPLVDQVLDEMVGDNLGLLEGVTRGTSWQPIGITSEKQHTGRWFVFQPDSVLGIVEGIKTFMERWTMPLLNIYLIPADILSANERRDARLVWDRAQTMRVIAAALACDRRSEALAQTEKWFGAQGLRRRYQQVFDYVQQAA